MRICLCVYIRHIIHFKYFQNWKLKIGVVFVVVAVVVISSLSVVVVVVVEERVCMEWTWCELEKGRQTASAVAAPLKSAGMREKYAYKMDHTDVLCSHLKWKHFRFGFYFLYTVCAVRCVSVFFLLALPYTLGLFRSLSCVYNVLHIFECFFFFSLYIVVVAVIASHCSVPPSLFVFVCASTRVRSRSPLLLMYIFILMKRSEVMVCHGFKA